MLLAELKPKADSLERERQKLFFQIHRLNEDISLYSRNHDNRSRIFEQELSQLKSEKISHEKKLKARILQILQVSDNQKKIKPNINKYSYEQERQVSRTPNLQKSPKKHRPKLTRQKSQRFLANIRSICSVNIIRSSSCIQKPKRNNLIINQNNIFKKNSYSDQKSKSIKLPIINRCFTQKAEISHPSRQNNLGPWKNVKEQELLASNNDAF